MTLRGVMLDYWRKRRNVTPVLPTGNAHFQGRTILSALARSYTYGAVQIGGTTTLAASARSFTHGSATIAGVTTVAATAISYAMASATIVGRTTITASGSGNPEPTPEPLVDASGVHYVDALGASYEIIV